MATLPGNRVLGAANSTTDIDVLVHNTNGTIGFYGKVPVVQRPYSSAVHATSAASVSASFGATQLAILQELMATMIGLGIWATA